MEKDQLISEIFSEKLKKANGEVEIKAIAVDAIKAIAGLETELDTSEGLIAEQAAELEKHKISNPNYRPTAKIKSDEFRINHAVRNAAGEVVSIDAIQSNLKLIAELHKAGSTAVTKLS